MAQVKFKKQENMSRDEAAARLLELAGALGQGREFELERGGEKLQLEVPDQVMLELEVEIKDGRTELEVEIKWPAGEAEPASASA